MRMTGEQPREDSELIGEEESESQAEKPRSGLQAAMQLAEANGRHGKGQRKPAPRVLRQPERP